MPTHHQNPALSVPAINGNTRVVVLMAWPSGHVRTPGFLNDWFAQRGINAVVVPWAVRPEHLQQAVDGLRHVDNVAGIIVTIPHKQTIADLCARVEGDAAPLGVTNVLRREADGSYTGRMFDGEGFAEGMTAQGIRLAGRRTLLLGAGGAATAIALSLARRGIAHLTIANRSVDKAQALAALLRRQGMPVTVDAVASADADVAAHDLVVNATSLGLHAGDPLPCDANRIAPGTVVAEVIMQPPVTPLLEAAAARGATVHQGHHMVTTQLALFAEFLLPGAARSA